MMAKVTRTISLPINIDLHINQLMKESNLNRGEVISNILDKYLLTKGD